MQHHQRASKHQTLMHKETTPLFRSCQTLLGKLGIKVGSVKFMIFLVMIFINTTIFKAAVQQHVDKTRTYDKQITKYFKTGKGSRI